jgi:hypothetical protein
LSFSPVKKTVWKPTVNTGLNPAGLAQNLLIDNFCKISSGVLKDFNSFRRKAMINAYYCTPIDRAI